MVLGSSMALSLSRLDARDRSVSVARRGPSACACVCCGVPRHLPPRGFATLWKWKSFVNRVPHWTATLVPRCSPGRANIGLQSSYVTYLWVCVCSIERCCVRKSQRETIWKWLLQAWACFKLVEKNFDTPALVLKFKIPSSIFFSVWINLSFFKINVRSPAKSFLAWKKILAIEDASKVYNSQRGIDNYSVGSPARWEKNAWPLL